MKKQTKTREPSVNHTLYGLYLDEMGNKGLYNKTRTYSLSDIRAYVKIVEEINPEDYLESLNVVLWNSGLPPVIEVDKADYKYIKRLKSILSLHNKLSLEEVEDIKSVIIKISQYHKNRMEVSDGRQDNS